MTTKEVIRVLNHIRSATRNGLPPTKPSKAIEAIDLAISALERDRWISVEERLPDEYGEYMVLWRPKQIFYIPKDKLLYEITEYEDGEWIGDIPQSEPFGGYDVFYWRELPDEPKEET